MECLVFKKDDYQAVWNFSVALRDRFGKTSISTEDSLRLQSLRTLLRCLMPWGKAAALDDFLKRADSLISFGTAQNGKEARL